MRKLLVFLLFYSCQAFEPGFLSPSKKAAQSLLSGCPDCSKIKSTPLGQLHYIERVRSSPFITLFIHGSPGHWGDFSEYFKNPKLSEKHLISVDRDGYGKTSPGVHQPSLQKQAQKIITPFLKGPKKLVLVGHSYGGPVALQMALDYPEKIHSLLLLAASVDPELEKTKWFQYPARWPLIRSLIPESLDVCNREIFALKKELAQQQKRVSSLRVPVTVIQGKKDSLVPYQNAHYLKKHIKHSKIIFLKDADHFLPWKNQVSILQELLALAPSKSGNH